MTRFSLKTLSPRAEKSINFYSRALLLEVLATFSTNLVVSKVVGVLPAEPQPPEETGLTGLASESASHKNYPNLAQIPGLLCQRHSTVEEVVATVGMLGTKA